MMVRVCSLNKNLRDVMSIRQYYFLCEILMVVELNTTTFWLACLEWIIISNCNKLVLLPYYEITNKYIDLITDLFW